MSRLPVYDDALPALRAVEAVGSFNDPPPQPIPNRWP
jgi:hypothetical protein